MRKTFYWIISASFIIALFGTGFYIGTLDTAKENEVKITSQCSGVGVQKSFSAKYETKNGKVVKDEQIKSEKYTTKCLCYFSNRQYENLWVDTIEMSGNSADKVKSVCNQNCQKLCEERLSEFSI